MSAYLHDVSMVIDFNTLPTHNSDSARIAEEILSQYGYPKDEIKRVSKCILSHTSPIGLNNGSLEVACLFKADALSQIINLVYWLYFAFGKRKLNYSEGRNWCLNRINDNCSKLIDPAENLVESDYMRIKEVIYASDIASA